MSAGDLPEAVRALLHDQLKSFEELEVLLLVRARPLERWTVESASSAVHLDPALVAQALAGLEASGLVARVVADATYQYRPLTPVLAAAVEGLAKAYREQHAAVMSQMSINAIERIRSGPLRVFADSFLFRKRKDDDG
jgi:hypothetical protein